MFGLFKKRRGETLVKPYEPWPKYDGGGWTHRDVYAHQAQLRADRAQRGRDREQAKADVIKRIDERLERIEKALERSTCDKVARMDRMLKDARSEDVGQVKGALGGMDLEAFERIMEAIGVEV